MAILTQITACTPFNYLMLNNYLDNVENKHFVESKVIRRDSGEKSIPVIVFADDSHLTETTNAQLVAKLGIKV